MKKYDEWNEIKKSITIKQPKFRIKPREIYWVKIGQNVGDEEYGKGENFARPVIVIKKLTRDLFMGIPTSTTIKDNDYFHPFEYTNRQSGDIKVSAMILQLKTFSMKRIMNKIGVVNKVEFEKILEKSQKIFAPT